MPGVGQLVVPGSMEHGFCGIMHTVHYATSKNSMQNTIYTDAIDSLKNKVGINITEEIKIGFLTVKFSSTLKSFTKLGIGRISCQYQT